MATEAQIDALARTMEELLVALHGEEAIGQAVSDGATTVPAIARALRTRGDALLADGTDWHLFLGSQFRALADEIENETRTT